MHFERFTIAYNLNADISSKSLSCTNMVREQEFESFLIAITTELCDTKGVFSSYFST